MVLAQMAGDEHLDRLADQLLLPVTEHSLKPGIRQKYHALVVRENYAVRSRVEEQSEFLERRPAIDTQCAKPVLKAAAKQIGQPDCEREHRRSGGRSIRNCISGGCIENPR